MCLADGSGSFIPPAAILEFARKCRWVERFMCGGESGGECGACGDGVLPAEGEQGAATSVEANSIGPLEDGNGVGTSEGSNGAVTSIVPWGWNRCLKESLIKEGVPRELLPGDVQLDFIREASRRETALELLEFLHGEGEYAGGKGFIFSRESYQVAKDDQMAEGGQAAKSGQMPKCGQAAEGEQVADDCCTFSSVQVIPSNYRIAARSMEEIEEFLQQNGRVVLKAPLSGSGKGIRFVAGELMETDRGWCKRILQRQGAVIVEQRMEIVQEFAMLFEVVGNVPGGDVPGGSMSAENSRVKFRGYSLFYASNGAYKGNLLASNEFIEEHLCRYIPLEELRRVRLLVERFLQEKLAGRYVGFVGVDQFVAEEFRVAEKSQPAGASESLVAAESRGTAESSVAADYQESALVGKQADGLQSAGKGSSGRKFLWNPAMEINLRMTMGLVARNIYDFHREEFQLGEATHCFEPERGIFPVE